VNDKPEWKTVHEVKGAEGVTARVQRRGDYRPLYSVQMGRERRQEPGEPVNDRLLPFVPVRVNNGSVDRSALKLMEQALDWIEEDAQSYQKLADLEPPPQDRWNGGSGGGKKKGGKSGGNGFNRPRRNSDDD
jgi:hypothetical protein